MWQGNSIFFSSILCPGLLYEFLIFVSHWEILGSCNIPVENKSELDYEKTLYFLLDQIPSQYPSLPSTISKKQKNLWKPPISHSLFIDCSRVLYFFFLYNNFLIKKMVWNNVTGLLLWTTLCFDSENISFCHYSFLNYCLKLWKTVALIKYH